MGVFIYACKLKNRVGELADYNELLDNFDEDVLSLENYNKYDDLISPFNEGVYTYESCTTNTHFSYGGYDDFLTCLRKIGELNDNARAFSTTLSASGIDNCVSYKIAEEMLEEFETNREQAKKYFIEYGNTDYDDYGDFLYDRYEEYIDILIECIEIKGVIRYH